jgi:hypothetical protein
MSTFLASANLEKFVNRSLRQVHTEPRICLRQRGGSGRTRESTVVALLASVLGEACFATEGSQGHDLFPRLDELVLLRQFELQENRFFWGILHVGVKD